MNWQLTAKAGPNRGESWLIGERPLTLGRSLSCEVNIEDPTVSRRHCQVYLEGDAPTFRDLGSRNVTLVNGTVVAECRLNLGDELAVGESVFILTRTAAAGPSAQAPEKDSSPSTVSLNRMLLEELETETDFEPGYPATARDVLRVFQFGRRLSKVTTEEQFASKCVEELEEVFSPEVSVAVWCGPASNNRRYPASAEISEEILEQVSASMATGRPTLIRHRKKGHLFQDQQLACTAPLMLSGECRGLFLATASARRYVLNESDLERLTSMALCAAPYQTWRRSREESRIAVVEEETAAWGILPSAEDVDEDRLTHILRDTQTALESSSRRNESKTVSTDAFRLSKSCMDRYTDPALGALEKAERTLIRAVLSQCGGNVAQAAKVFGTTPAALQPLIDEMGLDDKR